MTPDGPRPRLLIADADAARRADVRSALADDFVVAEAERADEVLAWLDQAAPGCTLLDHALPGSGGAALVGRIGELFPDEVVLLVAPDPSVELCRAAMRAGAFDCLDRTSLQPHQVRALAEAAQERFAERTGARAAAEATARAAVRLHEREAAARLCTPAATSAWRAADLGERTRWMSLWDRALTLLESPAERRRALEDVVEALGRTAEGPELLAALHLHATAVPRPGGRDDAVERARDLLVEALQLLACRLAAAPPLPRPQPVAPAPPPPPPAWTQAPPPLPAGSAPAPGPSAVAARAGAPAPGGGPAAGRAEGIPDLLWHRWCLADGGEEWTLVGDGRPLARVSVVADACHAYIRDAENGGRVVAAELPPVPNGLREVERRLGLPPVLTVRSASVA